MLDAIDSWIESLFLPMCMFFYMYQDFLCGKELDFFFFFFFFFLLLFP